MTQPASASAAAAVRPGRRPGESITRYGLVAIKLQIPGGPPAPPSPAGPDRDCQTVPVAGGNLIQEPEPRTDSSPSPRGPGAGGFPATASLARACHGHGDSDGVPVTLARYGGDAP